MPADDSRASVRLPDLTPQEPIRATANFSYRVMSYSGKGFVCIGDAHCFIDPIFADEIYFGIQEGEFATDVLAKLLSGESTPTEIRLPSLRSSATRCANSEGERESRIGQACAAPGD